LLGSPWINRGLLRALVKREILGRYRGSFMGLFWSLFHPVLMLIIYTFVFSVVFKARWGTSGGGQSEFALVLFAGLIVFNLFSECVNRAPSLILSNVNYVKKVVFPLEILPWVSLGSAGFHALISLAVWFIAYGLLFGIPHWTVVLVPFVVLPLLLFTLGLMWCLASLGVYLRDVSQVIGVVTMILMFMSPIFYPIEALPAQFRDILQLNPLAPIIEQFRDVLYWGRIPNLRVYAVCLIAGGAVTLFGFAWFQKTRKGFADVL
jgi:lipopolysaccharide transport system permease protein